MQEKKSSATTEWILIYSRCIINQHFSVYNVSLALNPWENFSQGVMGGYCSTLVLLQVRPHSALLWNGLVGTEATVGLSLWSAAVGLTLGNMSWLDQHIFRGGCFASSFWSKQTNDALTGFRHKRHSILWKSIFHCIAPVISVGINWLKSIFERSLNLWHILTHKHKSHHPPISPSFIFFIL